MRATIVPKHLKDGHFYLIRFEDIKIGEIDDLIGQNFEICFSEYGDGLFASKFNY